MSSNETLRTGNSVESVSTLVSSVHEGQDDSRTRRLITVEPIVLLVFFGWNVSSTVFQDQVVFQVCVSELGYNFSDCIYLGTNNDSQVVQDLEKAVQRSVTDLIMTKSVVEATIPAILSLFIGPWSDKFGRKPMIIASLIGFFFTYLIICILCAVSHAYIINPWYYVLASIPIALGGGICTLITGMFCYTADITSEKNRAVRMGVVEAALFVGLLVGSFSSSYIYNWSNSTVVFGLSTGSVGIALLYAVFFLEESKEINELEESNMIRELFRFELVKEMFAVCFKRRPNHDRAIIWMIMISLGKHLILNYDVLNSLNFI